MIDPYVPTSGNVGYWVSRYELELDHKVVSNRLAVGQRFDHDFDCQPQLMQLFVELFGPYPVTSGYTVVVTDDDLEIPLEAQGISIFGANHCDGRRGAERLIVHDWPAGYADESLQPLWDAWLSSTLVPKL